MADRATLEPFPAAAFVLIWVGFAVVWWSSIGIIAAGFVGLVFGAAELLLSKNSQLVFEPSDVSTADKRRFFRKIGLEAALTALVIPALAYVLPKVTKFIFPVGWVQREPAVLYYLGGLGIAWGLASFILSRKFA